MVLLFSEFSPLQAGAVCRRQVQIVQLFSKNSQNSNFHSYIWIQHEKCIQMSTNKPSIGPVVLEIASVILSKYYQFCRFCALKLLARRIVSLKVSDSCFMKDLDFKLLIVLEWSCQLLFIKITFTQQIFYVFWDHFIGDFEWRK